jgi:hypothetical protein
VGTLIAPERRRSGFTEYRSDNTERLSEDELAHLLDTSLSRTARSAVA